MSNPVQGNQFFSSVQNQSSLSVQELNADSLEVSNLEVGNSVSFFGVAPVGQQPNIATIADNASGTQVATAVNGLINHLITLGLISQ